MKASPKDKRTKDQLIRLLDDALVQEEQRADEINALRAEVEELRKRAEDPRAELVEDAIPSSKVPFRLDFYRTTDDGPLKGIIEHLPSRQKRTFAGDGHSMIFEFVSQFLPEDKLVITQAIVITETEQVDFQPLAVRESLVQRMPLEIQTEPVPQAALRLTVVTAENEPARNNSRLLRRLHKEFLTQFPDLETQSN